MPSLIVVWISQKNKNFTIFPEKQVLDVRAHLINGRLLILSPCLFKKKIIIIKCIFEVTSN